MFKTIDMYLGKKIKDRVTGATGVVTSVSFDLYGCVQAVVVPPLNEKGELLGGKWFDVSRLEIEDDARVMPLPAWEDISGPEAKPIP
jgi:hypothetical protein